MTDFVLDASGLLAMLKGEKGGSKVADGIDRARMSAVNYGEVVSHFIKLGMPDAEIVSMLDPLPISVISADRELAHMAGRLRSVTADAGLSLGDRFCLALAQQEQLPAWTSDKVWKSIAAAVDVQVIFLR